MAELIIEKLLSFSVKDFRVSRLLPTYKITLGQILRWPVERKYPHPVNDAT